MRNLLLFICCILMVTLSIAQDKGIINNGESPHVKFKSVDLGDCTWTSGFWADKFKVCEESMVPYMRELLTGDVGHGLNNFKIVAGLKEGEHKGTNWHDGDFYKFMEAVSYLYAQNRDEELLAELDSYIEIIGKAQEENGYIQTASQIKGFDPFTNRGHHEMYNSGHLYTSACIHHRVTGKKNFLDIAVKHADNLYRVFQPQPAALARFGYNQTQIMGLVELYRSTGEEKYLELAEIFINMRGKSKVEPASSVRINSMGDHVQERKPIRKETEAVGHAVLALYFYAGAADVYAETGEKALLEALDRLWENVVDRKMYVTGACGQAHHGASSRRDMVHEAFIDEYMMPNMTAYNETCANICNSMFSYRLLGIHGEARYADIMELVLYNSALSGISIEGKDYFYANPLRKIHHSMDYSSTESANREPYINCFCCPPNLVRTIAKVAGWAYSLTDNGVAVNLYGGSRLSTEMLDGSELNLTQETQYPWKGKVQITMGKCKKEPFELLLRIPGWADEATIMVNGEAAAVKAVPGKYATIERKWKKGDVVTLNIPVAIKLLEGHPRIEEVRNQVAIKRGPVVYCIESPDLPEGTEILDVYLPAGSRLNSEHKADLLGGVTTIKGDVKIRQDHNEGMYRELGKPEWERVSTQFVPYFAWSNRGTAEMSVWIPYMWE